MTLLLEEHQEPDQVELKFQPPTSKGTPSSIWRKMAERMGLVYMVVQSTKTNRMVLFAKLLQPPISKQADSVSSLTFGILLLSEWLCLLKLSGSFHPFFLTKRKTPDVSKLRNVLGWNCQSWGKQSEVEETDPDQERWRRHGQWM